LTITDAERVPILVAVQLAAIVHPSDRDATPPGMPSDASHDPAEMSREDPGPV